MSELSRLITEANREKQWSTRDVMNKARAAGFKISHGTVGKVLNGTHGRVDLDTVYALEHVFKIHRDRITAAAGVPRIGGPYSPPEEAVQLTERQRRAVSELIVAIVKSEAAVVEPLPVSVEPALELSGPDRKDALDALAAAQEVREDESDAGDESPLRDESIS